MIGLYSVLLFMIIGSIFAIQARDLLSSIVALGAVGLGLSLAFLILKAPDVAIMQLVVEVLCLIILVRATLKKDIPFEATGRWVFNTAVAVVFVTVFLIVAMVSLLDLPEFGYPIMKVASVYLKEGLLLTGAADMVGSISLDFRAYDTLGEATVLFTAVIGVLVIVRKAGKKKELLEEAEDE